MEIKIGKPDNLQIAGLRHLWKEAFKDTDAFLDVFWETAFSKERSRCIIIDNTVAAALYWFDCEEKIAYIYAVATAKEFRGQGLCHKLMKDTHEHLKSKGYVGVILVPGSAELFRLYEDMGYRICSRIREFHCMGKPENVVLEQIGTEEYARLRRTYLPKGGMVQEKENIDFLEKQVKFYAGADFLLAASVEAHDVLRGVEILGNIQNAAQVVHALGCREGYFRTPGEGLPFAMYYSFDESTAMPGYFGLAFD